MKTKERFGRRRTTAIVAVCVLGLSGSQACKGKSEAESVEGKERPNEVIRINPLEEGEVVEQAEPPNIPPDSTDWNDAQIKWWPLKEGAIEAREKGIPIMFLSYRPNCSASVEFTEFFRQKEVVELSKRLVMIREDKLVNPEAGESFDLDGVYVPRVVFLTSDAQVRKSYVSGSEEYMFYYSDWDVLIKNMRKAAHRG